MDELEKLYGVVSQRGLYTKSFDEFKQKYSDPESQAKLFSVVSEKQLFTKSKDEFTSKYFPTPINSKKKNSNQTSTSVSETSKSATLPQTNTLASVSSTTKPETFGVFGQQANVTKEQLSNLNPNFDGLAKQNIKESKEKEKGDGFLNEIYRSAKRGSEIVGRNISALPEFIYDAFALPQNAIADTFGIKGLSTDAERFKEAVGIENTIKNIYENKIEITTKEKERLDKKYSGGVYDNFSNGNIEDGFRLLSSSIVESLPASLAIAVSGGALSTPALLTATTSVFGAGKNEELKQSNPEMSNTARTFNAFGNGFAEGVFSTIGTGTIGVAAKEILKKEGVEQGGIILKDNLIKIYKEALKKYSIPAAILGEGLEEAVTQITQNSISKFTGESPDIDIMEGVADAFLIGAGSGGGFGIALEGIKKATGNDAKVKTIEAIEKSDIDEATIKNELLQQVKDGDLNPREAKDIYDNWEEIKSGLKAVPQEFTSEQKAKSIDLINQKKQLEKDIVGKDPALVEGKKAEIESINQELKNISQQQQVAEPQPSTKSTVTKEANTFATALGTPQDISDVANGATKIPIGNTDVIIKSEGDNIKIESITTKTEERGKGSARTAVQKMVEVADAQGKTLELNVVPEDNATSAERLVGFYESEGFVKGENFDINGGKMTRVPQTQSEDTSFDPLDTEGKSLARLSEPLQKLTGLEKQNEASRIAKEHAQSYREYVNTQPNAEDVLATDFAKNFEEKARIELLDGRKVDATQEVTSENGSRIDENGNQVEEAEFLVEEGKIDESEITEDTPSPTVELNPENKEVVVPIPVSEEMVSAIDDINKKSLEKFGDKYFPSVDNPNITVLVKSEVEKLDNEKCKSNQCETNVYKLVKENPEKYYPARGYFINKNNYPVEHWLLYDRKENKYLEITPNESKDIPEDYIKGYVVVVDKTINDKIVKSEKVFDVDFFKASQREHFRKIIKEENATESLLANQPKTEVKEVNHKGSNYDITFDERGNVQKITKKDGKEISKFKESKVKVTKKNPTGKKITVNSNFTQIEATALGVRTDNSIKVENKAEVDKAMQEFEPTTEYEHALFALASGTKINSESAQTETGLGKEEVAWVSDFKNQSELKSVEGVAEGIIADANIDLDMQEVRNALIEIIKNKTSVSQLKSEISESVKERNQTNSEVELRAMIGSLSERDLAIYESIKAEDDFISELSDKDAIEYYEQQYESKIPQDEKTGNTTAQNEQVGTVESPSVQERDGTTTRKTATERKAIANADIDEVANWLKQALPKAQVNTDDINTNGFTQDQLIDFIASTAKTLVSASIDIDTAIKQVIDALKQKYDFDVNADDVKAKAAVETKPQAFTMRSFESENLNETTKAKLEKLGLDYDVENQDVAQANAEKIVNEFGILEAYKLAVKGTVRGGARTWIKALMFEELNVQIFDALGDNNTELVDRLTDEHAKIMKEFANEKTLSGQEMSMLNRIYRRFDMKYNLDFAKEKWQRQFGSEMTSKVEAIFKLQEEKIKQYQEEIKELETKIGTLEEQQAVTNIQEVIKRHQRNRPSASSLQKAASALRKAKFTKSISDLSRLQSDPLGLVKGIFDGAIETIATALDKGATIEQAVKRGIEQIKQSDWYKKLTPDNKRVVSATAKRDFEDFINEQISVPDTNPDVEEMAVKIPSKLIYELVASGIDNIGDLTDAVHEAIKNEYPNLTKREVRDAITGYGKQINENKDQIQGQISKLKTDGKQASALEDLAMNKRPERSGRKPKDYTPEQRNNIKKIRELLKTIPIDDVVDKAKYYKTALESYKTRLENRIKDLNDAINKDERIINEKRNTPLDDDAKLLIQKRDNAQKEYNEHFGKPYKSDETLVNEIVRRKEKSLKDLNDRLEYIKLNNSEQKKADKGTVTDPQIDVLTQEIEAKRDDLSDLLEDVGIAEAKRLDRAKKYTDRRINELRDKIKNGDFTKRKPKTYVYDRELIELKGKLLIEKTKFDIQFEKQELKEAGLSGKLIEGAYLLFGTIKGLKATADFSAMLRQGILLGSRNPVEYAKATVDMHKFAFSSKEYQNWRDVLESTDDFIYMMEDGLEITDTSGDVLRGEERFVGNLLATKIMADGLNVNVVGIVTKGSERAYGGFLNSLRVSVYRKIVAQHEAMGYTRQKNPKLFKNIAKFVNNATGRGSMTTDRRFAKVLNAIFFSPRMITGMVGVVRDMTRKDSTRYLRGQAATSLITFIGYQFIMKQLIISAYGLLVYPFLEDDDEEKDDVFTADYNPVSTDFNKLTIGNTRYDLSSGWGIAARTLSRFVLNEKSSGIGAPNVDYSDLNNQTAFGEVGQFFENKMSPLASQLWKLKLGEHPTEFYGDIKDATTYDYMQALFIPITISELTDGVMEKTPKSKIFFDTVLNGYGVSVQNYDSSPKEKEGSIIITPPPSRTIQKREPPKRTRN